MSVDVWGLAWWLPVMMTAMATSNTALNLLTWPRGRPVKGGGATSAPTPSISILIPARNEAVNIEASVRAAAMSQPTPLEIIVCDDNSADGTGEILTRLQAELPTLRVIQGRPLTPGWVGKPHACHQLAQAARGELLLFIDADVRLAQDGIGRVLGLMTAHDAQVITAVPRQHTGSPMEELILPLLHLTYTAWLPLALIHSSPDPAFLAANGQILAFRRESYRWIGGFEAVRCEVVDDMAICRNAKRAGLKVVFADGGEIAECRMYRSAAQVWKGFSKNLYEGIGAHPLALVGVLGLYFLAFVAPYLSLMLGIFGVEAALAPGLVGVGLNLVLRVALAWRFEHSPRAALAQPIAVLALLGLAINSYRWSTQGTIEWAGRIYPRRSLRGATHGA